MKSHRGCPIYRNWRAAAIGLPATISTWYAVSAAKPVLPASVTVKYPVISRPKRLLTCANIPGQHSCEWYAGLFSCGLPLKLPATRSFTTNCGSTCRYGYCPGFLLSRRCFAGAWLSGVQHSCEATIIPLKRHNQFVGAHVVVPGYYLLSFVPFS